MDAFQDPASLPSKSQLKREMSALQDMGEELTALSREQLKRIDLPEELRAAVLDAQRFGQREARRRQMQYVGKLMRLIDPAPIRAALDEIKGVSSAAIARMHALERLREKLLADEAALGEILQNHPRADVQHLRQLRRNALKEQQLGRPPRAYRELFRELKTLERPVDEP